MSETAKKVYKYSNRLSVHGIKPAIIKKIQNQAEATGGSKSSIVAAALELYFKNNPMRVESKHAY
jgi:threonine aldolase